MFVSVFRYECLIFYRFSINLFSTIASKKKKKKRRRKRKRKEEEKEKEKEKKGTKEISYGCSSKIFLGSLMRFLVYAEIFSLPLFFPR